MKIMTIFGTRPEIIRLSLILKVLDQHCQHITVHTGENADVTLKDIFIRDLEIRTPDVTFNLKSDQAGDRSALIDSVFEQHKPDRVLVFGGSNSALAGITASRRKIPVFHMDAGSRCFDESVSEEVNCKTVDHAGTVLLPYTNRSKDNLLREGIEQSRIFVTGNPIKEVLDTFEGTIETSDIMNALGVKPFEYFLVTVHRSENIDDPDRLKKIFGGLADVTKKFGKNILVVTHPYTAEKLDQHDIRPSSPNIRLIEAMSFFDLVKLEKNSLAVLTDSGSVQEECCISRIPNITLRDVTDRPETIECGSNILSGTEPDAIVRAVELAIAQPASWTPPAEYLMPNVSQIISRILLGYIKP